MANPEVIGEWIDNEVVLEEILYVADDVFLQLTGERLPIGVVRSTRPSGPDGDAWEEGDLESMYPQLSAKLNSPAVPSSRRLCRPQE
jgi:hypothetical protein